MDTFLSLSGSYEVSQTFCEPNFFNPVPSIAVPEQLLLKRPLTWSTGALSVPKVWSDRLDSKFCLRDFPEGEYGKKIEKFSSALRRIDVVRSNNIVRCSQTSHFVENCLDYNPTWFKQNFIVDLLVIKRESCDFSGTFLRTFYIGSCIYFLPNCLETFGTYITH